MIRMNWKTFSLALCLGTFSLGAHHAALAKEPELYFYPTMGWTVKSAPFNEVSTGAPICILMNQFNNGFLVQMTGSKTGPDNLSVDFRQPAFTEGSSQDVTLSVPGAGSKTISAKAQSPELLVIGMKDHAAIFSAMRTAGVFDMSVGESAFRFYLTGFADAGKRFDTCTGGVAPAAEPAPTLRDAKADKPVDAMKKPAAKETENAGIAPPPPQPEWLTNPLAAKPPQDVSPVRKALSAPPENMAPDYQAKPLASQLREEKQRHPVEEKLVAKTDTETKPGVIDLTKEAPAPVIIEETAKAAPDIKPAFAKTDESDIGKITWKGKGPEAAPVSAKVEAEEIAPKTTAEKLKAALSVPPAVDKGTEKRPVAPPIERAAMTPTPTSAPSVTTRTSARTPEPATTTRRSEGEFDMTRYDAVEPASSEAGTRVPTPMASRDDKPMNAKISEMERTIQMLKAENDALNSELKSSLRESETERLSISSENWNLERATMRFNEAERQLQRMGQDLQKERAACSAEKQNLEAMLFDPEVTNQQQLARLATLEQQAEQSKAELETQRLRYEERIRLLEAAQRTQ